MFPWILGLLKAKNMVSLSASASICMQMCSCGTVTVVSDVLIPGLNTSQLTQETHPLLL